MSQLPTDSGLSFFDRLTIFGQNLRDGFSVNTRAAVGTGPEKPSREPPLVNIGGEEGDGMSVLGMFISNFKEEQAEVTTKAKDIFTASVENIQNVGRSFARIQGFLLVIAVLLIWIFRKPIMALVKVIL